MDDRKGGCKGEKIENNENKWRRNRLKNGMTGWGGRLSEEDDSEEGKDEDEDEEKLGG